MTKAKTLGGVYIYIYTSDFIKKERGKNTFIYHKVKMDRLS